MLKKIATIQENAELLYSMTALNKALDCMALKITEKLSETNPIILCVMTGALIPTGYLVTRLNFPLEIDYIHVTRYQETTRGGDLHWLVEPRKNLNDRTILVIDDIMDGGLTLNAIIDYCKQSNAKKVYSAVMVSKERQREPGVSFEPDFVGVYTPDRYLFGFGLDYEGYLRNAAGIFAIND
jgi:hypoxanthine phosphoribosyltransferase